MTAPDPQDTTQDTREAPVAQSGEPRACTIVAPDRGPADLACLSPMPTTGK